LHKLWRDIVHDQRLEIRAIQARGAEALHLIDKVMQLAGQVGDGVELRRQVKLAGDGLAHFRARKSFAARMKAHGRRAGVSSRPGSKIDVINAHSK
jgi:hypothetical protein